MALAAKEPDTTASNRPKPPPHKPTSPNPFTFWFYFILTVSLITLLTVSLSFLTNPQDPKAWFLSLPPALRQHYSAGRTIKVQTAPNHPPLEVFSIQDGPTDSNTILIVHGLGCSSYTFRQIVKSLGHKGIRTVAIDLPGSGFSDKSTVVVEENLNGGVFGRVWEIYSDIKEKGLFWGFDQLIENGYVDFEANEVRVSKRESVRAIELGPEEVGRVLVQVVDSLGLAPVDLVLHDSALGLVANWVSENLGLVRSMTLLDTTSSATALPLWVLEVPVVREVVLGFEFVFSRVVGKWCWKSIGGSDVEAHRVLLKGRDGREAVVGMGRKLNGSFDLGEWSSLDGVKGLPMQVMWSSVWSEEWNEEGRRVADALPQARFVTHSGGRWPQGDTTELAENIYQFVSSLPKSIRQAKEEPIPEHIQKLLDEAESTDHHNHHHGHGGHHHSDGHGHAHAGGYMDAYGLDHGWAS